MDIYCLWGKTWLICGPKKPKTIQYILLGAAKRLPKEYITKCGPLGRKSTRFFPPCSKYRSSRRIVEVGIQNVFSLWELHPQVTCCEIRALRMDNMFALHLDWGCNSHKENTCLFRPPQVGGMMDVYCLGGKNLVDLRPKGSQNYPIHPFGGREAAPKRVYC